MPPNPVTAVQELNNIIQNDESKNRVAVHTFDPDAPPEVKAQAAGAATDKLKSVKQDNDHAGGKGMCHVNISPVVIKRC